MKGYRELRKIDERGCYQYYPGVTVVANLYDNNEALCKALHERLSENELICRYYSPLPASSYHMTAMSVCNAKFNGRGNWEKFVADKIPFFRKIHSRVEEVSFSPQISVDRFRTKSVIQGIFTMPDLQKNLIMSLSREFGLQDEPFFTPHVTLAYQYRTLEFELSELIEQEIQTILFGVFKEHDDPYFLAPLRLCYFDDMQKFITWNGDRNPFISVSRSHDSFFGGDGGWPRLGSDFSASHSSAYRK